MDNTLIVTEDEYNQAHEKAVRKIVEIHLEEYKKIFEDLVRESIENRPIIQLARTKYILERMGM